MTEATVDTALQQLLDRSEITDLVSRLGVSLDEGRFDEMRSLLVEEVTASTPGGAKEGRDAVIALARKNHRPGWGSEHVTTNLLIDLDGDQAKVRANMVVHLAPDSTSDSGNTADWDSTSVADASADSDGSPDRDGSPDPDGASLLPLPPKITYTLGQVYRFEVVRTSQGWRFLQLEAIPVWYWGTRPRPA
jgi:hypothetical protein